MKIKRSDGYFLKVESGGYLYVTADKATEFDNSEQVDKALYLLKSNQGDLGYTFETTWNNGEQ